MISLRKKTTTNPEEVEEEESVRIPRVLVRSSIWAWTGEDLHPAWAPGSGRNQPVEPGAGCTRLTTLMNSRLDLKPGGNRGVTSKCSGFAHEEAEAQKSEESCTSLACI